MLGKNFQRLFVVLWVSIVSACGIRPLQTSVVESDAVGRRVLSQPQEYHPQGQGADLQNSMEATRAAAWRIFAEVVSPVSIITQIKDGRTVQGSVPGFITWFTAEDAQRWFREAVRAAPKVQLEAGIPLGESQSLAADEFLIRELDAMPDPLQKRLQFWVDQHPNPNAQELSGLGGTSRVYYSPALIHSALQNYSDLGRCFQGPARPDALTDTPGCLQHELPPSSAIVKAAWYNGKARFKSFATDPDSLKNLMADPASSWSTITREIPAPDTVFSVQVGQDKFLLPGFHIMTKDQKDWFWLTAWWSPDADSDFGSDRPEFVRALGPQFSHYKICAVTRFQDDAQDWDELARKHPDLVAAFRAAQSGNPGQSWCSNPYLEAGVDNQRTNCIGCHQFAGTRAPQDSILHDAAQFPAHGTQKQRTNFVTDYIWSAGFGGQSLFNIIDSNLTWRKTLPGD